MADDSDAIDDIERQLDKMESTATNLETLSALATRNNKADDALALSNRALDIRVQQFSLYRKKEQLVVSSSSWKALTASLELVNHFIEGAMSDLNQTKSVLDSTAQVISVATKIAAALV